MDNDQLRAFVMEKLRRWKRLTYSDVQTMLPVVERPRFRREVVDELARSGAITVEWVGDEQVLALPDAGRTAPLDEAGAR